MSVTVFLGSFLLYGHFLSKNQTLTGDLKLVQSFSSISFHVEWLKEKKSLMMKRECIVGNQDKAMACRVVRWSQGRLMVLLRWCAGDVLVVLGWVSGWFSGGARVVLRCICSTDLDRCCME